MFTSASSGRIRTLLPTAALAGVAAAAVTTAIAATASAADVSLEVDGQALPLSAFPWWTLIATVAGVAIARFARDRRRFLTITVTAATLSLVPPVAFSDDASTAVTLVLAHLAAAAILIPALTHRLVAPAGVDRYG